MRKLAEAKENLARVTDDVELQAADCVQQIATYAGNGEVSQRNCYALRTESSRVSAQQLEKGEALQSQAQNAVAQEFDAKTSLLQSQLDYIQARDEVTEAMGQTPE